MTLKVLLQKSIMEENFGFFSDEMCHEFTTSKGNGIFHQHLLPLEKAVGQFFLKANLYSQGLDFTHTWQTKKNHENRSYLKRIWKGEKNLSHHDSLHCWTLLDQQNPIGIATLEQTQRPLVDLGRTKAYEIGSLSVYLEPSYRHQGRVKALIQEEVLPTLQKLCCQSLSLGATPFIGAEDAAAQLLVQAGFEGWVIPFHFDTPERTEHLKQRSQKVLKLK